MDNEIETLNIKGFYSNRDIFITGGLGFIGKVLIEKLLRSCSDLNKIYILIRSKRSKAPTQRLKEMIDLPLFDLVKQKSPILMSKLIAVAGDVSQSGLGISSEHIEEMRNVSVIFHSAATVRFNESMKDSILINTKGTYEIIKFAENLKNLKVLVHVSTTYCNLDEPILEEKVYSAYTDWKYMIQCALESHDDILNQFLEKHSKNKHNTYTLSKHLSEQICNDFKDKLPLVIFRPAIVIPTAFEPIPGWIDNFNGPGALLAGVCTGLIRTVHADPELEADFIPADVCAKVLIVSACKKGSEEKFGSLSVYNCSSQVSIGELNKYGLSILKNNPFERTLWAPDDTVTNSKCYYVIRFFILQLLPAIILDSLILLVRQKPFLVKLQKKSYIGNEAIYNFLSTHWTFKVNNTIQLDSLVSQAEFDQFAYWHLRNVDHRKYLANVLRGAKKFLFNEPIQCSKLALVRFRIMIVADKLIKLFLYCCFLNLIFKNFLY